MRHTLLISLVLLGPACIPVAAQPPDAGSILTDLTRAELTRGERIFQAQCSRCHGIRGTGGQGPPLDRPRLRHATDDEALLAVIRNGLPETGMPGAWQLSPDEARLVAGYVRSLGRTEPMRVPGDPERGRRLYEGEGGCAACHIVRGEGTGLGPELTDVGARRGPEYLWESLVDPGAALPEDLAPFYARGYAEYLPVRIVTREGSEIRGFRLNEDVFTIQVRDLHGRLHSFRKTRIRTLEKEFGTSVMPDYGSAFTETELQDLVAYLASLRGEP